MSSIKVTNLQNASAANPAFVLAADGSATANLSSVNGGPIAGSRNRIINGDMRIDQRNAGASVTVNTTANTFTLDRWAGVGQLTDGVFTVQQSTSTPPTGFTHFLRVTTTTADASIGASQFYVLRHAIEGNNVSDLGFGTANAKQIALSFWVRSSLTGTFGGSLANDAITRSYVFSFSIGAANTWEYKTITLTGDTSGTWETGTSSGIKMFLSLGTGLTVSGTAGSWGSTVYYGVTSGVNVIGTLNATFDITGVQLEPGSVATPFERRSYGAELVLAQRYYYKDTDGTIHIWSGKVDNAVTYHANTRFPVTMRAAPTVTLLSGGESLFTTARTVQAQSIDAVRWTATTGGTAGNGYFQTQVFATAEL
jgi:hypothetical protein